MRDLLKGNSRLVITYWVFGVIPAIIYNGIGKVIEKYYFQLATTSSMEWFFYLYLIFPFIYFPLIYVAIWRSSNTYKGRRLWRWLAKLAVILGAVLLVVKAVLLANLFFRASLSDKIKMEVTQLKKALPSKIDSDTEIYAISFDHKTITYRYRLLKADKAEIDVNYFNDNIKPQLIKEICSDKDLSRYVKQGIIFSAIYDDKKGAELGRASVKPGDCK